MGGSNGLGAHSVRVCPPCDGDELFFELSLNVHRVNENERLDHIQAPRVIRKIHSLFRGMEESVEVCGYYVDEIHRVQLPLQLLGRTLQRG